MIRGWFVGAVLAGVLSSCAIGARAQPIAVADLQRLLQEAPKRELRFRETRESPWLAAPIESSGSMTFTPTMLEKRVEQPRREILRILTDRLELVAPGATSARQLMFSEAPAVAALAGALRQVMAGDLQALDKDFRLTALGDERQWTLQLAPRRQDISRFIKQLELQGAGPRLQVIMIEERQGERSTTRLTSEP